MTAAGVQSCVRNQYPRNLPHWASICFPAIILFARTHDKGCFSRWCEMHCLNYVYPPKALYIMTQIHKQSDLRMNGFRRAVPWYRADSFKVTSNAAATFPQKCSQWDSRGVSGHLLGPFPSHPLLHANGRLKQQHSSLGGLQSSVWKDTCCLYSLNAL